MKKLATIVLLLVSHLCFAQNTLTLQECYQLALKQSERVAIEEADIKSSNAKYSQAIGSILPKISFKGTEFLQDDSASASSSGVGTTFTRFSKPELKFNAKQPIFAGFREFNALKAMRAQKRGNEAEWEQAKRNLFLDVTKAFYSFLQLERDVAILKEIEKTLKNRLMELKARTQLGKSRISEQLATESDLAMQQATLSDVEGSSEQAKEILYYFTGVSVDSLKDDLNMPKELPEAPSLLKSTSKRPDIKAAREARNEAKSLLSVEKGARFPSINVEANYYTYRVGFQENIKWDSLFSLDVPIFQGGQTRGKIQEAKIHLKQAELASQEKHRQVELEIKQSYNDFLTSQKQVVALETAKAKAEKNFRVVEQDYQLGLVNNLEVLATLKNLQEIKREFNRTLAQAKVDYFALKVATGEPLP